jgi:predicted ATPase
VELRVRIALAAPLMAVRGYAASPVGESYERARVLCASLGAERELVPVLRGLVSYHQVRGELPVARALGEELLARVAGSDDVVARVQAHYGHGATLFHGGDPVEGRGHFERALALYRPEQRWDHLRVYGGWEPSVACRLWLAWTLRVLGFGEQCRAPAREALALADELGHPLTRTFAHYGVGLTHQMLGEGAEALRYAESAMALAEEHGFAYELSLATLLRGWVLTLRSRVEEGLAELQRGLEGYLASGARLASSYGIQLAAAEAMAGRLEEARDRALRVLVVAEGREHAIDGVEVRCGAARILLELAARKPRGDRVRIEQRAESLLEAALALARAQRAPLLELIAATALARHRAGRSRRSEARELLAGVLGRFAEGQGTRVQRQAARLLEELS